MEFAVLAGLYYDPQANELKGVLIVKTDQEGQYETKTYALKIGLSKKSVTKKIRVMQKSTPSINSDNI